MYLALVAARVLNRTVAQGKQGVVLAAANVLTGMEMRAMLAHDNITRVHSLTCKLLAAQTLCVRIASVSSRSKTLLMCHVSSPTSSLGA